MLSFSVNDQLSPGLCMTLSRTPRAKHETTHHSVCIQYCTVCKGRRAQYSETVWWSGTIDHTVCVVHADCEVSLDHVVGIMRKIAFGVWIASLYLTCWKNELRYNSSAPDLSPCLKTGFFGTTSTHSHIVTTHSDDSYYKATISSSSLNLATRSDCFVSVLPLPQSTSLSVGCMMMNCFELSMYSKTVSWLLVFGIILKSFVCVLWCCRLGGLILIRHFCESNYRFVLLLLLNFIYSLPIIAKDHKVGTGRLLIWTYWSHWNNDRQRIIKWIPDVF